MPSYPVKVWDGSQWVEAAAQPTDLTNYATTSSVQQLVDDIIDPYFLMGA